MKLSRRVASLEFSVTLELDARAKELRAQGVDVVSMAVGEPDFPAPPAAQEAAIAKVKSGDVRYTPAGGTASLRAAIARHVAATRGVPLEAAEVAVCHSAKHALSAILLCLVDEGDEVLVPLPAWASYFEEIKIAGGTPVLVPPRPDGRPDLDTIESAITDATRLIMVNSPSNPTGYVWTDDEVEALAELTVERDLWILSDEIYRRLVYTGPPPKSTLSTAARERTIVVDGASKCFAMTGYRIGFAAGPAELVSAIARLNSQLTGSPNAISQAAYEAALDEEPPEVETMIAAYAERRRLLLAGLEELGLKTPDPRGAYYAFPDVSAWLDERGSVGFCQDLLEEERLALVPGAAFGLDGHVRLSYAIETDAIREALRRLGTFLATRAERVGRRA